ncbi:MAG: HAD family hydrolase [Nanoarchaeota archaeon]
MSKGIIVVDFSGTLIKPEVAEQANLKRYARLGIPPPSAQEHKQQHGNKSHYDVIRDHIEDSYGLTDEMQLSYVQNRGDEISISGKDAKTMIMTDLFRDCMFLVAREQGRQIFTDGMLDTLAALREKGFQLAIASGIRTDIITGMLAIAGCTVRFDHVVGQDPVLSRDDNELLMKEIAKLEQISYVIGDKLSDLEPARALGATSIFLKGGHPTGGEEEFADHVVDEAREILELVR